MQMAIYGSVQMRDYIDSNREESPLAQAEDALVLDNTALDRADQLKKALAWAKERAGNAVAE